MILRQAGRLVSRTLMTMVVLGLPFDLRADAEKDFNRLGKEFEKQLDADDYQGAEQTALQMVHLAAGPLADDPEVLASALNDHGRSLHAQDRYAEAERVYKRSLAIWEKARGPEDLEVAVLLDNLSNVYLLQEKFDEAEPLCERALQIRKKLLRRKDPDLAISYRDLADIYYLQDHYAEALALYEQALAIQKEALSTDDPDLALTYASLGDVYFAEERYDKAEPLYQQALAMREKALPADAPDLAASLIGLADLYDAQNRSAEAEKFYRRAAKVYRRAADSEQADLADCLNDLGALVLNQGRNAEAEPLLKEALAIYEKVLGPEDERVATALSNLGALFSGQGRYAEAEPCCRRAMEICRKVFGPEGPETALCLNDLAGLCLRQGRYAEAETRCKQALVTLEKALGPVDLEVAECLTNLGLIYDELGRYAEAERLCKRSLAIYEKLAGADHLDVAWPVNNLANLYDAQGRYAEGEPLHKRALAIREKHLEPEHPDLAASYNNLAGSYFDRGRYAEAEPLYARSLAIVEKIYGKEHPDVALALSNLACLFSSQGRYAEAEPLLRRAAEIYEKLFGGEHADTAMALANLADLYWHQERYAEAEPLYKRALAIREKVLGPEHPDVANNLIGLADLYGEQERYAEAEPLYRRAVAIAQKVFGPEHVDVAVSLASLADLYHDQRQYTKAEPLIDRAISILERVVAGPGTQYDCYLLRARITWKIGRRSEALVDLRQAMQLAESQRALSSGAEQERAKIFGQYSDVFELMVAWQAELGDTSEALAAAERGRARSLRDELRLGGADLQAGRSAIEREQLRQAEHRLKQRIASLQKQLELLEAETKISDRQGPPEKQSRIQQLRNELSDARAGLYERYRNQRSLSPVYRNLLSTRTGPTRISQIRRRLVRDDGLLLVYLLGKEGGYVLVIGSELAEVAKLEVDGRAARILQIDAGPLTAERLSAGLIGEKGAGVLPQLKRPKEAAKATEKLAALWRLLIPQPQREALTDGTLKRLIVVPDGQLAMLPLETLVVRGGDEPQYLLDAGPPIIYGPSATVLCNLAERPKTGDSADREPVLTVGSPSYSGRESQIAAHSASVLDQLAARSRYNLVGGKLTPLPYSGWESGWVVDVFSNHGIKALRLEGAKATEANLRSQISGRRIVHLACHGLADQAYGNFYGALALAPGPAPLAPADDGFLTLAEIYELKLQGTELAILSACDTNYGPQQRGEGVWALSRGFLVAGSRRVVASNWLVDDEAAASLISYFCSGIANAEKQGQEPDYAQSLHKAKRWVRQQAKWQSPYYWGTFVLVGPD